MEKKHALRLSRLLMIKWSCSLGGSKKVFCCITEVARMQYGSVLVHER